MQTKNYFSYLKTTLLLGLLCSLLFLTFFCRKKSEPIICPPENKQLKVSLIADVDQHKVFILGHNTIGTKNQAFVLHYLYKSEIQEIETEIIDQAGQLLYFDFPEFWQTDFDLTQVELSYLYERQQAAFTDLRTAEKYSFSDQKKANLNAFVLSSAFNLQIPTTELGFFSSTYYLAAFPSASSVEYMVVKKSENTLILPQAAVLSLLVTPTQIFTADADKLPTIQYIGLLPDPKNNNKTTLFTQKADIFGVIISQPVKKVQLVGENNFVMDLVNNNGFFIYKTSYPTNSLPEFFSKIPRGKELSLKIDGKDVENSEFMNKAGYIESVEDFNSLNKTGYYADFEQTQDLIFDGSIPFTPVTFKNDNATGHQAIYDGQQKEITITSLGTSQLFDKITPSYHQVKNLNIVNHKEGFSVIKEINLVAGNTNIDLKDMNIKTVATSNLLISNFIRTNLLNQMSIKNINITITSDFQTSGGILFPGIWGSYVSGKLSLEDITIKANNDGLVLKGGLIDMLILHTLSVKNVEIQNIQKLQVEAKDTDTGFVGFLVGSVELQQQLSVRNVNISFAQNPLLSLTAQTPGDENVQSTGFGGYFGELKTSNKNFVIDIDKTPLPNYDPCLVTVKVAGVEKKEYSRKLFGRTQVNNPIFANTACEN